MKFQHVLAILATLCVLAQPASATGMPAPTFTPAQVRADLESLERALHEMPPDLAHSADAAALERGLHEIHRGISDRPLTRVETWKLFAALNPLLADGHLFVGFGDWREDTRAHLAAGGMLFPFEMLVTPDCELRVRAGLGGRISPLADSKLATLDGRPARVVCEEMLRRAHGDTRAFRADLVSRRFWLYYWKLYGAAASHRLGFDGAVGRRDVPGSGALPAVLADEADFGRQFSLQLVAGESVAILRLGTFAWPDKQAVVDFTHDAFARLRGAGIETLIIDVRDNGGGDDVFWIEGVMPFLADKPFRTGSTYRKRVVVPDPARGEVAGSVVDGEIETWFPAGGEGQRFRGKVYVAVGPGTYSSAVVFANVVQDFGFGSIAGTGGSARTAQTGGVRRHTLTHTGLTFYAPRFIIRRPSGRREPVLLTPDVVLDPSRPLTDLAGRVPPSEPSATP